MGSFAVFHLLPASALVGLREVWPDTHKYLNKHAKELHDDFDYGGFAFYQLIEYLKEKKNVDLGGSHYHLVFPAADTEGIWFLDRALKAQHADQLEPSLFSSKERHALTRKVFGQYSPSAEEALLETVKVLKNSLEQANDLAVVILQIIN